MSNKLLRQLSIAFVPFFLLLVLMSVFAISVKTYIRCEHGGCDSITENLYKVILPVEPNTYNALPGDTEQIKKEKELKRQEIFALSYSGRVTFIFLANLYFFICLIAAAIGVFIIYKSLRKDTRSAIVGLTVIIGISLAVGVYLYIYLDTYLAIFNPLFNQKIENDLKQAKDLMISVNSFGFAVCTMLCLAICAVLYLPLASEKSKALLEASEKMEYLRAILYLGTIMLIVGMLVVRSVYQWSLAFTLREDHAIKTAENFFSNLLAVEGGFSTLVLAAAYLPSAFIIYSQVNKIKGLPQNDAKREEELKNYNLTFSFSESLPRIIAILAPILAGPVGELFNRLSN